jgi:hypothetical protein
VGGDAQVRWGGGAGLDNQLVAGVQAASYRQLLLVLLACL